MNFVEELKWRGMIHDIMPGTKEQLDKELTVSYLGIDPTAGSLHIGHLVGVMLLKHFQLSGHKPIALIGGATGMIGDPSGKSQERNLLDEPTLRRNQESIKKQLSKFLDFIRDIGKHITVNYMMSKDSVKKRLDSESSTGMSFTEFTYQLVQGTDFLHLYQDKNVKLQMGGSDQWGNITTGTELIRRKTGGEAFALTCPLIKKADGTKFGKTESGNVWLDPKLTSPYKFFQFWLNTSDEDAEKYIKIFTLLQKNEIAELINQHSEAPHLRLLQKRLAEEVTVMVHSREDYEMAVEASQILFGQGTAELLRKLDKETFLAVFEGVPQFKISGKELNAGIKVVELLAEKTMVFPSKGEIRRTIQGNGLGINKDKVTDPELLINADFLIDGKYILIQKGKKNYFLLVVD